MNRSPHLHFRARFGERLFAASLMLGLILSLATPAAAGAVHGRVTWNDNPVGSEEITLTDTSEKVTIQVKTDSKGNYAVVLAPGTYKVTWNGHTAAIQSYLGRARQDIKFSD